MRTNAPPRASSSWIRAATASRRPSTAMTPNPTTSPWLRRDHGDVVGFGVIAVEGRRDAVAARIQLDDARGGAFVLIVDADLSAGGCGHDIDVHGDCRGRGGIGRGS